MVFNEKEFKEKAEEQILRCRPGDWNHALRTVQWVKDLGRGQQDLSLLIAAAYIHDVGWRDILSKKIKAVSYEEQFEFEKAANANSERFVREFLENFEFSENDILKILRFVRAADAHESGKEDEAILVDADNLSKLNIDHIKEKYQRADWLKMYNYWLEWLPKRVKTKIAKEQLPQLLADLKIQVELE